MAHHRRLRPTLGVTLSIICCLSVSGAVAQQRFRVRPSNTSVIEGDSTILRCEVDHQVGQLQWAKQGFAMGYSRHLPGYPRYRLLGDPAAGVHDLQVTNVTLEDDGRFQCQVSPNKGQASIRTDAYLTVILKPQSVRLRAFVGDVPTSGVVQVARGVTVTLTCDVTGARPAAAIEWQRNGRHLEADGAAAVTVAAGDERRHNSRSSLTLEPSRADDGAGFSCVARHAALPPTDSLPRRYNATLSLSVLYPPGPPVIRGYTPGQILRKGEQRTLTCFSEGGNPPARLVWTRNGRAVGQAYRTTRSGASATYTFIADQSDLHAIYRCNASSSVSPEAMTAQVETIVHFAPKRVTVSGPATARAGDVIGVSCSTSGSNPASNLTWVVSDQVLENTTWTARPAADGGWVSVSNVTSVVPAGIEHDLELSCYAQNPAVAQTRSGTALVSILQAPQPPTILGYERDEVLQAGERVTLSCLVRGGNPRPRLSWLSGGRALQARLQTAGRDTLSLLTLAVTAADNGRQLTCRSRSAATDRPSDASATLRVSFPPSRLDISVSPRQLRAGPHQQAELTCESRPSLPAAQLSWWSRGQQVTEHVLPTETLPSGAHGGYVSRSVLRKPLRWTDDGAELICRAEMAALTGTLQTVRTLNVQHAPVFEQDQLNVTAVRGRYLSLNLTARANPPVRAYSWYRAAPAGDAAVLTSSDPAELTSSDAAVLTSADGVLNLTSVQRADAGWYRLQATNVRGSASARVHVDVLYPPEIIKTSSLITSARGEDVQLPCRAKANPLSGGMFRWSRPGQRPLNLTTSYANSTSFLRIPSLSENNAGDFECFVKNELGYDKARFTVVIKESARIVKSARLAKAAARQGETAHVTCRARGAPAVTFRWSRAGDVIDAAASGGKYSTERKQIDVVTWASVLDIRDVTASDYGEYECRAWNRLGADSHRVRLVVPAVPDPPLQLRVLNVSSQAVTLAWTPAFDGGFIQGFRFRYHETGSSETSVRDGDPNSAQFTVQGLRADTKYGFRVAGYSQLGVGRYTEPPLIVRTSGTPPVGYVTDREDSEGALPYPRLMVGLASLCGIVLLLMLNAVLISCCHLRRKQKLRHHAYSDETSRQQTSGTAADDGRSSLSARSVRSNSIEDSVDKPDDRHLLAGQDRCAAQSPFPPTIAVFQPEAADDVMEMTSQDMLLRRDSSTTVDDSYGYNHLRTSATFRDALADATFTPSPDVIDSSDVTEAQSWTLPRPAAERGERLVSFDDGCALRPDSAQQQA